MLVHRRVTSNIKFAGTHLYTWVERSTVRVKCPAQEHNTMSPARARTRTARSGDERTNHEATAPPHTATWEGTILYKSTYESHRWVISRLISRHGWVISRLISCHRLAISRVISRVISRHGKVISRHGRVISRLISGLISRHRRIISRLISRHRRVISWLIIRLRRKRLISRLGRVISRLISSFIPSQTFFGKCPIGGSVPHCTAGTFHFYQTCHLNRHRGYITLHKHDFLH